MPERSLDYRVEGNGPPLLLVHGFGISYPIWSSLLPLLRGHFTVLMVQLPGIGASPAPQGQDYMAVALAGMEQLRQQLGFGQWEVLGYSTGSRIAEAYACAHPDHVSRAVFLCPLQIDAGRDRSLHFGLRLDDRWPAFGNWILSGWRLRFLISWLGFNLRPDPRSAEWYAEISAAPIQTLKQTIRAMAASAGRPFSVPVAHAMIWAEHDLVPARPPRLGEHDYLIPGRHTAPVESAGEVAAVILSLGMKDAAEMNTKSA